MAEPIATHLPCPLDASCVDLVRVLVRDGKVVWAPAKHFNGCGRQFFGTETWVVEAEPGASLGPRD